MAVNAYHHSEWSCDTVGFIAIFVSLAELRSKKIDKERARTLLAGFLESLSPVSILDRTCLAHQAVAHRRHCAADRDALGLCHHLRDFLNVDLKVAPQHGMWYDFTRVLQSLFRRGLACPACSMFVAPLGQDIGSKIDREALRRQFPSDILKAELPCGKVKRMRLSADFQDKLVSEMVTSGKTERASHACKVLGVWALGSKGSVFGWEESFLKARQLQSWKDFEHADFISLAHDGKRLGHPLEETTIYSVWNGSVATWMTPMVLLFGGV